MNPNDGSVVSYIANGSLKLFRLIDGALKITATLKGVFSNHAYSSDRVIAAMEDGKISIFDSNGEMKAEFNHSCPISALLVCPKGLMIAAAGGVTIYERVDDPTQKECYRKGREYRVDDSATILKIATSPSEEFFVAVSDGNQLYYTVISGEKRDCKLENFHTLFHHSTITGLDTCIRKPIVVTTSIDKSIRVWNYLDESLEMVKYFSEEAACVSVHPSGLYILVGFRDKLRLLNLLIDDISMFKEFAIKSSTHCKFSKGGQYFVVIGGNTGSIYSTWSFELKGVLKGHNGRITDVNWMIGDEGLVTCGMDGAVYEWKITEDGLKRHKESIVKSCGYHSICVDDRSIYAIGDDRILREIVDGQVVRQLEVDEPLTNIALSNSGKMLFGATASGAVRSIKFPFESDRLGTKLDGFQEHSAHSAPITRMGVSFDDNFLFTTSQDGCLFIFKIYDKDGVAKKDREIIYADEILVTKSDLEEKNGLMNELRQRVDELKMENEYQLRLKDVNFSEKIKGTTETFMQEIEALKGKSFVLKMEREKEEARHEEEMNDERVKHSADLMDMENHQNSKLMAEYDKYHELQASTDVMQAMWNDQMVEMQKKKALALDDLNNHYEEKVFQRQSEIDQVLSV